MLETLLFLIFLVLLILGGTVALLLYLSGALQPISVSTTDNVPFLTEGARFLYKIYRGSYRSVGGLFTEAYALTPGCIQCGIFYDDPQGETSDTDQRAAVGVLFDDFEATGDNKESSERIEKLKSNFFREFRIPPVREAIYAQFPHVSFLSILLGSWRVCPAVRKYAQDLGRNVSVMFEVYDEQTIHYIGLLDSHVDPYLVEEFRQEEQPPTEEEPKDQSEEESEDKSDQVDAAFEKVGHADLGDFEASETEVEIIQPKDQLSD
uniref:Testis-expressed sequence 264 protein n=1 Tax=Schistocephalus solidus TaxID=70667 RepID=A0A0X3P7Q4_SCHSO